MDSDFSHWEKGESVAHIVVPEHNDRWFMMAKTHLENGHLRNDPMFKILETGGHSISLILNGSTRLL